MEKNPARDYEDATAEQLSAPRRSPCIGRSSVRKLHRLLTVRQAGHEAHDILGLDDRGR